jgi:hypothetical protein
MMTTGNVVAKQQNFTLINHHVTQMFTATSSMHIVTGEELSMNKNLIK